MSQRLLLISPVRNEEANIERVADAVAKQTRKPELWVVVDDGSTDRTPEILQRAAARHDFMRVLHTGGAARREDIPDRPAAEPRDRPAEAAEARDRLATAAEARAFNIGLRTVGWRSFTHIAKLDGDTELPRRYFETLLREFAHDPKLGLAGGVYADPDPRAEGGWKVMGIPVDYHVPGTLKCYAVECFEAVGGVREQLGWDTIDETYARMCGFRTRAYPELVARHHRPWGTADGALRGRARHGECAYIAHFTLPWVAARAFKMAAAPPRGLSGAAFLYGYLRSSARGVGQVEDPAFRAFVRRELRERMVGALSGGQARLGDARHRRLA